MKIRTGGSDIVYKWKDSDGDAAVLMLEKGPCEAFATIKIATSETYGAVYLDWHQAVGLHEALGRLLGLRTSP